MSAVDVIVVGALHTQQAMERVDVIFRTMCAVVALTISSGAVGAAETRNFGKAGGFSVSASVSEAPDYRCSALSDSFDGDGSTTLYFTRNTDDPDYVLLALNNYGWSAKEGSEYEVRIWIDDLYYDRTAIGMTVTGKAGFYVFVPAEQFLRYLAAGSSLRIMMGNTIVDQLSLVGTAAAVAKFRTCYQWADNQALAAKRERDRLSHITKDPFAER